MLRFISLALALAPCCVFLGCGYSTTNSSTAAIPTTATSGTATPGSLPGNEEILRQIDDALDYTYDNRRLSVDQQAAWQIIHGALAFKREFLIHDGEQDVSAVEYVLGGRPMAGMEFQEGDVLDE